MKRLLLFPVVLLSYFGSYELSNAFMGDEFSLNMYENIDEGIADLENTIYKKHLKTDRAGNIVDIKDKISQLTNAEGIGDCFVEEDLSSTDIENIGEGRIDKLFESINEDCRKNALGETEGEEGATTTSLPLDLFIHEYYNKVQEIDIEAKKIAKEQAEVISETARIGIYSDGNDKNSPFDLIVDLQDIDNIIFSKEIPYLGVNTNTEDAEDLFQCLYKHFGGDGTSIATPIKHAQIIADIAASISAKDEAYVDCKNALSSVGAFGENFEVEGLADAISGGQDGGEVHTPVPVIPSDGNTLVCEDSGENTGLSPESLAILLSAVQEASGEQTERIPTSEFIENPEEYDENGEPIADVPVEYPENTYIKMKDNDGWPCTEFFCINTEFISANYDLLIGGKTKSIEGFLKMSNTHLKKFANVILVASKMTTNNFEMAWRDLVLADMFHSGVHIQFLPPPILNLDQVAGDTNKTSQELGDDFKMENLIATYYKSLGLDFERQNDLQLFLATDQERTSLVSTQELDNITLSSAYNKIHTSSSQNGVGANQEIQVTQKLLDKKVNNTDLEEFYLQFTELERFSVAIKDYSFSVGAIIQKMKEIPIHNNS